VAVPVIVIEKLAVAILPQASVDDSVKLDDPAVDGVPEMERDPSELG
jgi:hypothetical protein